MRRLLLAALLTLACDAPGDAAGPDAMGRSPTDAAPDAAPGPDAAPDPDAAPGPDTAPDPDAAPEGDATPRPDAGPDAGPDAADEADTAPPEPAVDGFTADEIRLLVELTQLPPLPPDATNRVADDPAAAELGHALFFSRDLSPSRVGCTLCHNPATAFSQPLTYDGHGGLTFRNVPQLLNAAYHQWFFWDGRADSAWAQVATPVENPDEMRSDRLFVAHAIARRPALRAPYEAVFGPLPPLHDAGRFPPRGRPDPTGRNPELQAAWDAMLPGDRHAVTTVLANVGKAIAAFERRLLATGAPFDAYVEGLRTGDETLLDRLTPEAKRGLRLFVFELGCAHCHAGPLFTDGQFHNIGLPAHPRIPADVGRFEGAREALTSELNARSPFSDDPEGPRARRLDRLDPGPADRGRFKTPSLRNVALTGPYGRDGRFDTLADLVRFKLTLAEPPAVGERDPLLEPREHDEADITALVAFLEALTGAPLPEALTTAPRE